MKKRAIISTILISLFLSACAQTVPVAPSQSAEIPSEIENNEVVETEDSEEIDESQTISDEDLDDSSDLDIDSEKEEEMIDEDPAENETEIDADEIMKEMGYEHISQSSYNRYAHYTGNNYLFYLDPIEEDVYVFAKLYDFDQDGDIELLFGASERINNNKYGITFVMCENEGDKWVENASYMHDGEYPVNLSSLSETDYFVFMDTEHGAPAIFVEEWATGVVATGVEFELYRLLYDGSSFIIDPQILDQDGDNILYHASSDEYEAYFTLNPSLAAEWSDAFAANVQRFADTLYGTGLQAPNGLHDVPLYAQNPDTELLMIEKTEFIGDHGNLWDWHSGHSDRSKPYLYARTQIYDATETNLSMEGIEKDAEDTDEYIYSFSSDRALTLKELSYLSDEDLQTAINEIYARHGYIFKDDTIRAYFEGLSWYKGTVPSAEFDASVFSSIEKDNLDRLQKERDRRK